MSFSLKSAAANAHILTNVVGLLIVALVEGIRNAVRKI